MKKLFILTLLVLSTAYASTSEQVLEEQNYYDYQKMIFSHGKKSYFVGLRNIDQKLYVDALEDALFDRPENKNALESLAVLDPFFYDLADQFRVAVLKIKYNSVKIIPADLVELIHNELLNEAPDRRLIYLMAANQSLLIESGYKDLIDQAKMHKTFYDIQTDESDDSTIEPIEVYTDLFYSTPDVTTYMNGEYLKSVKIFKFCRTNRLYPCLMIMKDVNGEPVREENGDLWVHPSLSSSARGLPSYTRNGSTPTGVMTIDSVMPVADQQISFGKNRRMILNFIPAAKNETLLKSLLPQSSADKDWWKAGVVARDIGRNLFRIHGTGKINTDPTTPYFPFMRTSGCIAQRENTYSGVTFNDQRDLLDMIMKSMELEPSYTNEVKVKGIIYILDLNDKNAPVSREDLLAIGIY